LDEALVLIALHGPPCCALGQRRGDGVIGRTSKNDASRTQTIDPGRAVISWYDVGAAEGLGDPRVWRLVAGNQLLRQDEFIL
jgi:hypothetical protein